MTEEFLYYIWKFRLFDAKDLKTVSGNNILIINTGERNTNAGPDFLNALIKIDDTLWAGNIEIHINSSDWDLHAHSENQQFNNIILHVVYNYNLEIKNKNIETIELKNRIAPELFAKYNNFLVTKQWIPCEEHLKNINPFIIRSWLEALTIERLEQKVNNIFSEIAKKHNDWQEVFYQGLAYTFGLKINASNFELLAKSLQYNILAKHRDNKMQIEALLYGQAGLLSSKYKDEYPQNLFKEYNFLKQKYSLKSLNSYLWKFLRLRPTAFPTIRISLFADLIYKANVNFSNIRDNVNIDDIKNMFSNIKASDYWTNHYSFDVPTSKKNIKKLGQNTIDIIIINLIVPFLFSYGKYYEIEQYIDKAIDLLTCTKGEKNNIISKWDKLGLPTKSAADTQALLHLYHEFCLKKKCLNCNIGYNILKT